MLGQMLPEALQIVQVFFPLVRRGDRMHLEAAGIERPAEAPDNTALTGSVPALQDDDRAMRGAQIGLLDQLQGLLHGGQAAFVIGKLH